MQLAFEMTLDQSETKRRYAKTTPTPAARLKNLFTGQSDHNPPQKTLLGKWLSTWFNCVMKCVRLYFM